MARMSRYKTGRKKRIVFLSCVAFLSFIIFLEIKIRPIIKTVVSSRAHELSVTSINNAVLSELSGSSEYSDLVLLQRNSDSEIISLSVDPVKVNTLKARISMFFQNSISNTHLINAKIPIGTLTGCELLNGRGILIPLKVFIDGCSSSEIFSEFSEAGINQTKYKVYIRILSNIHAVIPGFTVEEEVLSDILLAETVIVGKVPVVFSGLSLNSK